MKYHMKSKFLTHIKISFMITNEHSCIGLNQPLIMAYRIVSDSIWR
jgi:hypothetical protein